MRMRRNIGVAALTVAAAVLVLAAGFTVGPRLVPPAPAHIQAVWPEAVTERQVPKRAAQPESFTLVAVGDLMAHMPQLRSAATSGGFDFKPCFAPVAPHIASADLAIGNLETTLAGAERGYTGYPAFNSPDEYAEALAAAGFDALTTANNHCLDKGPGGLSRTLDVLDRIGLRHTGTARTSAEADRPLIVDSGDVQVAVLAYTYGINGSRAPRDRPWMVNTIDANRIASDVKHARLLGVDLVVVALHNGTEYERLPSAAQKRVERAAVEAGADVVLGSHPHVLQPLEVIEAAASGETTRTAVIAHSLGNFVSNQRERYRDTGIVLKLEFKKDADKGKIVLESVGYTPVWVDDTDESGKEHRVLPIGEVSADPSYPGVTPKEREQMRRAWADTTRHLGGTVQPSDPATVLLFEAQPRSVR